MTESERAERLAQAELNVARLDPADVALDLSSDAPLRPLVEWRLPAREPDLQALAARLYGPAQYVFTNRGRSAERALLPAIVPLGAVVVGHPPFLSTRRALGQRQVRPESARLARDGSSDLDLDWLAARLEAAKVDFVCLEPGANANCGWPLSLENAEGIHALCRARGVRILMDASRLLSNCERFGEDVFDRARRFIALCDAFWASCSKELLVPNGALIGVRDAGLRDRLMDLCFMEGILFEPRNARLRLGSALKHVLSHPALLADRARQLRAIAASLRAHDVPIVEPVGGHAVYVDVGALAARASVHAIEALLYRISGIHAACFPLPGGRQALRLALGIGRYSDEQLQPVGPALRALLDRAGELPSLREKRLGQSTFFGGFEVETVERREPDPRYVLPGVGDRERLQLDLRVLHDSLLRSVARTLEIAGVDPGAAERFRVLDVACGEGLYAAEIARAYPRAEVVAFDRDGGAIASALRDSAGERVRFLVHDAGEPLPAGAAGPFDVAQVRLGLTHFDDPVRVLANLRDALRPGGGLYLLDVRGDTLAWPHPSMRAIEEAAARAQARFGLSPAGERHVELLERAGFQVVETAVQSHPADPVSGPGRDVLAAMVETACAFLGSVVFATGVMSAAAFDDHIRKIRTEVSPEQKGECRFQITYARRP